MNHEAPGAHRQAADCYRHAVDLLRDTGDRYHRAITLTHLGDTYDAAGNAGGARDAWSDALTILTGT